MSHTCRGTISLHGALIHTVDACTFVVSNGGTQTFHIKASTEVERQQWVTALELAKAKAIQAMESGSYESFIILHVLQLTLPPPHTHTQTNACINSSFLLLFILCNAYLLEEEEEEYQDNDNQKVENTSVIKDLTQRLQDLQACNDVMVKHGTALQRALTDLEALEPSSSDLTAKLKVVNERATLFRIAATAMVNVSSNNKIFVKFYKIYCIEKKK